MCPLQPRDTKTSYQGFIQENASFSTLPRLQCQLLSLPNKIFAYNVPSREYYRDDRRYTVYRRMWPQPELTGSELARLYFSESRSEVVGSGNQGTVYRVRL